MVTREERRRIDALRLGAVGLLCSTFMLLLVLTTTATQVQAQEREEEQEEIRDEEAMTVAEPEEIVDKPEWHIEATEPEQDAPFDANTLGWDYGYVMRVVGAEARGEPVEGIMAVAQCILDTAIHDGITPEEVVRRPGQYADPLPSEFYDGGELVNECMLRVFACGERAVEDDIEFFCTTSCSSAWHRSQRYVTTIGGHDFFARWE